MTVRWNGKKVQAKLRKAQIMGVDQTMAAAERHAVANHTWQNRTGILEGSINTVSRARPVGGGVSGLWGVQDNEYALIQELGGTIKAKAGGRLFIQDKAGKITATATSVTIPARLYLRPAADAEYPGLTRRIRRAYA